MQLHLPQPLVTLVLNRVVTPLPFVKYGGQLLPCKQAILSLPGDHARKLLTAHKMGERVTATWNC